MRLLLALAAYAALTVSGFAQTPRTTTGQAAPATEAPKEITARDKVELRLGQARTFEFDRPFNAIRSTSESVVKLNVQTDQTFTLMGAGPGEAIITVDFNSGEPYRMSVVVGGRTVRIYGTGRDEKDYLGFFCTSTECGRGDSDAPAPNSVSVETQRRDRSGNVITTTKQY